MLAEDPLRDLLSALLEPVPERRIRMANALRHDFFRGLDLVSLRQGHLTDQMLAEVGQEEAKRC